MTDMRPVGTTATSLLPGRRAPRLLTGMVVAGVAMAGVTACGTPSPTADTPDTSSTAAPASSPGSSSSGSTAPVAVTSTASSATTAPTAARTVTPTFGPDSILVVRHRAAGTDLTAVVEAPPGTSFAVGDEEGLKTPCTAAPGQAASAGRLTYTVTCPGAARGSTLVSTIRDGAFDYSFDSPLERTRP